LLLCEAKNLASKMRAQILGGSQVNSAAVQQIGEFGFYSGKPE
jgi:hypothetical protein